MAAAAANLSMRHSCVRGRRYVAAIYHRLKRGEYHTDQLKGNYLKKPEYHLEEWFDWTGRGKWWIKGILPQMRDVGEKGILNAEVINQQIIITESFFTEETWKEWRKLQGHFNFAQWSLCFLMSAVCYSVHSLGFLVDVHFHFASALQISSLCTTLHNVYKVFRTLRVVLLRSLSS